MNKKKNNKKKILPLILLLLLTTIMLSTSTYAWFTANKTVTIQSINVNVATSSGLQISTDAKNWKSVITNNDITEPTDWKDDNTNQFPSMLVPVSTAGDVDTTSGHLKMFSGDVGTTNGEFSLTSEALTEAKGTTGKFIAFDIFLRTEESNKPIYLTTDSNVIKKANTDDKGLKNAARVAFVVQGNAASTAEPATLRGLKASGSGAGIVTIWEPNSDVHTSYGVAAALEYYNKITTVGPGADALDYEGVYAAISSPVLLKEANSTKHASNFKAVTTLKTIETPTAYTQLITLASGVTKIRVYLWVEGQDVDCENNASGSDITYNIVLSQNSAPVSPAA